MTTRICGSKAALLLTTALAMTAAMPGLPVFEVRRRSEDEPLWPKKPEPDNRGRRAEKDALALAKAEAKRQRKAAKRVKDMQSPNAKVTGTPAALSPEAPVDCRVGGRRPASADF